jgi:hypothetical protein
VLINKVADSSSRGFPPSSIRQALAACALDGRDGISVASYVSPAGGFGRGHLHVLFPVEFADAHPSFIKFLKVA